MLLHPGSSWDFVLDDRSLLPLKEVDGKSTLSLGLTRGRGSEEQHPQDVCFLQAREVDKGREVRSQGTEVGAQQVGTGRQSKYVACWQWFHLLQGLWELCASGPAEGEGLCGKANRI